MSVRPHPSKSKKEPGKWWHVDVGYGKNRKVIPFNGSRIAAEAYEAQLRGGCDWHHAQVGVDLQKIPIFSYLEGPFVYFIQQGLRGPIKIGYTDSSITSRIRSLQTANPEQLRLVGYVHNASVQLEAQIHEKFNHLRLRGEWFSPSAELVGYVRASSNPTKKIEAYHLFERLDKIIKSLPRETSKKLKQAIQDYDVELLRRVTGG